MSSIVDVLRHKGTTVFGIDADRTVFEAIGKMTHENVGSLVVWNGSGEPVGILTERDYLRRVALAGRSSKTTRVDEIMSKPLVTVAPETSISDCMRAMTHKRIRHLAVMEGRKLEGLVSMGDLVRQELQERGVLIDDMLNYIGSYPPESSRPPPP